MQELEPYYRWRSKYIASEDERSPFFNYQNSEVFYTHAIYDHVIHPQWDTFGSETLVLKQLWADYDNEFTIIELFGEWNDTLHNDIMFLKRNVIEPIIESGINKFILIVENILNYHGGDDDYYAEWQEELEGEGWIVFINTPERIKHELEQSNIDSYIFFDDFFNDVNWRTKTPLSLFKIIDSELNQNLLE